MIVKLPLPFISNQVDVEIKKTTKLDPLDFYILLIPYLASKKAINYDEKLFDVIKREYNLNENFFNLINERIEFLINLKMLDLNKITKIDKDIYVGNLTINQELVKLFDNDKFLSFEKDARIESVFYYRNLCLLNRKFEFIRKNNDKYKESKINIDFNENTTSEIDKETASNTIREQLIISNNETIVDYIFLDNNSTILIDFDFEFNIDYENSTISLPLPSDLKTFEDISKRMPNYFNNLMNYISSQFNIKWDKKEIKDKKLVKKTFKFDYEFSKIEDLYSNQSKMFPNSPYSIIIDKNDLFILGADEQKFKIQVLNEPLTLSTLNKYKFNDEKEEFEYLKEYFDFNTLSDTSPINDVGEKYLSFILVNSINKFDSIYDKNSLFDFYLKNIKEFEKVQQKINLNLNQSFFNNKIHDFLIYLFKLDAKSERKYINEFRNFEISEANQKILNSIYNFDYSKNNKYFKNSNEEIILENIFSNLTKLNNLIKEEKVNKFQEIISEINKSINTLKWIDYSFIHENEIYIKAKTLIMNSENALKDEIALKARNLREIVETFIINNLNLEDQEKLNKNNKKITNLKDFVNKNTIRNLTCLKSTEKEQFEKIYDFQNTYNHSTNLKNLSVEELEEVLKKLNKYLIEVKKITE